MLALSLLLAALDPFVAEDAAIAARKLVHALPAAARVTVQPVQNRTTEHLDVATFTAALERAVAERERGGERDVLKVDVHLTERATEKRYVVQAALVQRETQQKTWLHELVITKRADTPPGPPPFEARLTDEDAEQAGRVLFAECLSEGWLDEARAASLAVGPVENRTDERIPVAFLRRSIERSALNDPRVKLFERDADYTLRVVIDASTHWAFEQKTKVFRVRLEAVRVADGHLACVHTAVIRR